MSFSTALLPPDPSDVTNELRRRIQVLEDSMRMPGVGGYAAEINANATPAVSVALDFTDPAVGAPGPVVKLTVPKSGRVLVMITARSIINADAGAARAAVYQSIGVALSTASTVDSDDVRQAMHGISTPAGIDVFSATSLHRSTLYENVTPGPATFKMFYLASHDASSGIHGLIGARTLTVVPL
jgi:hypothetical protein